MSQQQPKSKTTFRLHAKKFFLTYPHFSMDKFSCYDYIDEAIAPIKHAIIAEEAHSDGTPHMHIYVEFQNKLSITNKNKFDLPLGNGEFKHGNYQTVKNPNATQNYCKKDTDFEEFRKEDEAVKNVFDMARELPHDEFIQYCLDKKISHAYFNEILKTVNQKHSITDDTEIKGKQIIF